VGRGKLSPSTGTVAERFIRLFESCWVHCNLMSLFFGHNLSLTDVKDGELPIPKLTDEMLNAAEEKDRK